MFFGYDLMVDETCGKFYYIKILTFIITLQPGWWGYDMRRNMEVATDAYGMYFILIIFISILAEVPVVD